MNSIVRLNQNFVLLLILFLATSLIGCGESNPTPDSKPSSSQADNKPDSLPDDIQWPANIEPTSVPMELVKVSEHAYFVQGPAGAPTDNDGFMSNAGAVVTPEGVVIFDALGTPSLAYKLLSLIRKKTDQPVKKVIVSHYHADHIYGLQVFKELGAEIIAPLGAKEYLASDAKEGRLKERRESLFPWVNDDTYVVEPDTFIEKDVSFKLGGVDFEILVLGATHSQGDMMLHIKPDNVLYSGDLVFEGRIPFVAGSRFEHWIERLDQLDTGSITAVVPGHGPMSINPKTALQFTRDYIAFLNDGMKEAVENLMPFDEAYSNMDWSSYEKLPAFQVNRINSYYIYLQLEALSMQ